MQRFLIERIQGHFQLQMNSEHVAYSEAYSFIYFHLQVTSNDSDYLIENTPTIVVAIFPVYFYKITMNGHNILMIDQNG